MLTQHAIIAKLTIIWPFVYFGSLSDLLGQIRCRRKVSVSYNLNTGNTHLQMCNLCVPLSNIYSRPRLKKPKVCDKQQKSLAWVTKWAPANEFYRRSVGGQDLNPQSHVVPKQEEAPDVICLSWVSGHSDSLKTSLDCNVHSWQIESSSLYSAPTS